MSEYTEVEPPLLQQLAAHVWTVIDQGTQLPQDAVLSLRSSFRAGGCPACSARLSLPSTLWPTRPKKWLRQRGAELNLTALR